jgi:hypothetical protein
MAVLVDPPRESFRSMVSVESLNGTYDSPFANAKIQRPNADKEELMLQASFFLWPVDYDFFNLSEPPRSAKMNWLF